MMTGERQEMILSLATAVARLLTQISQRTTKLIRFLPSLYVDFVLDAVRNNNFVFSIIAYLHYTVLNFLHTYHINYYIVPKH